MSLDKWLHLSVPQFPCLLNRGNNNSIYLRKLLRGHRKGFRTNSAWHITSNKYQPLLQKKNFEKNKCICKQHHLTLHVLPSDLLLNSSVELKSSTPHIWEQLSQYSSAQTVVTDALSVFNRSPLLFAFSWIIVSSQLSSPRMCAWSSIPGMPRSRRHAHCAASLAAAIQSHQTRKFLRQV